MAFAQSTGMAATFKLPLVPGMTCGEEMLRRNYHRGQVCGEREDGAATIPDVFPEVIQKGAGSWRVDSATTAYGTSGIWKTNSAASLVADGTAAHQVSDKELAGRVLRFYCYSVESVPESAIERERVRQYILYYFLEDSTISMAEPRKDNSGFPFGGTVLKRHVVNQEDGTPITFDQLRVGGTLSFYGRTYVLYDADEFTREFFSDVGLEPAQECPVDTYTQLRSRPVAKAHNVQSLAVGSPLHNTLSSEQVRATQRFLSNDRKVLRCDCVWDDTEALFGQVHFLTLYYFLADGTIAVVEKDQPNSGRDPFPNFSRRERVAKPINESDKFDPQTLPAVSFTQNTTPEYYTAADIRIGNVLSLYGRRVKICDYNAYTRQYLAQTFGIHEYCPLPGCQPPPSLPAGSVRRKKVAADDDDDTTVATTNDHAVVKFLMKLDTENFNDLARRFVLAYRITDGTIAIFEPVQRNSGVVGGKFLQRQRVRRSDGGFFTAKDFYVGARVVINSFPFVILETDNHSLKVLEESGKTAPPASIAASVARLQAMLVSASTGLADALLALDRQVAAVPSISIDGKSQKSQATLLQSAVRLGASAAVRPAVTAKGICDAALSVGLTISLDDATQLLRHFQSVACGGRLGSYSELISRVLPNGVEAASNQNNWESIWQISLDSAMNNLSGEAQKAAAESQHVSQLAARAARIFLELYDERRHLFNTELRFISDYAPDSLIGAGELTKCLREKLKVGADTLPDEELGALCVRLFPQGQSRVPYEELHRLMNGTSTLSHNVAQIAAL